MKTISSSEFRRNMKTSLDEVSYRNEVLSINRPGGTSVVAISIDDFNYLVDRSSKLAQQLEKREK